MTNEDTTKVPADFPLPSLPPGMELGVTEGRFHGFKVLLIAMGKKVGERAIIRPLAVLLEPADMEYITGPEGEPMLNASTGKPAFTSDSKVDPDIRAGYL